ncbi:MAG: CDP-alcohol phosphatidyltransferase family protein, partial [Syntrophales bacterium]|nr:CDP-alcohol phosphatidyltransferase family protein [Syntrophales bacterium]
MSLRRKRKKKDRRRFRGVYLLPNLITSASLFAGFFAIIAAIDGKFLAAAWAIFIALILDGLDGRIARMTQSTSSFGVQYD